ncbi:MAG: methionyl-tRNA formyltransferase [Phycisphaerae bacterium]
MRIILLASGDFAAPTLRWLAQSEHDLPLVITQPSRPSGRGRRLAATPVGDLADTLGIETLQTPDVNASDVLARARSLDARLALTAAFGQKLGPAWLAGFPGGCLNLHASLLPKYRGAAPIHAAILQGEARTGCTVFRMTDRMDAGPVLVTRWTHITPEETAGQLHDRLSRIGVDAVDAALRQFDGGQIPSGTPQDDAEATTAPKLSKRDGFVRLDRDVAAVTRHIRAMTPWPGAAARYASAAGQWERLTIVTARADPIATRPDVPPGTIDARRYVAARDGFVEILEVKPSSGRLMTWADYVNGRHVQAGDRIVSPDD